MLYRCLIATLLLLCPPLLHAQLPPSVTKALQDARIPLTSAAVVVQSLDAGTPLLTHNDRPAMNPASVMKLLTTYAGLDLLGPAHAWSTTAWRTNVAVDGQLRGNLYIKGSGDPRFAIEHLWSLLRQIQVRGISRIDGDIVLDRSAFASLAFDPAAFDNKPLRPYNVGPDALLLNFHALRFVLQADDTRPRALLETPLANHRLDNRLQAQAGPCPADWKDRINLRLQGDSSGPLRLELTGSYASQCGERVLNLAPLAAAPYADSLIRALWRELGGELTGQVRDGPLPADAQLIARHESATLADLVRDINKYSNNVMARQLFLSLGNDGAPASAERARQRIDDWLARRGLHFPELVLDNGSGLSRSERISAASLNRLLLDAWASPVMPELISSLPVVGIDGTMKKRLNGSPVSGRAHVKTGTLDGVRSAAGYALDSRGRRYAFVFMVNDPRAQAAGPAIDALLTWIAERGR